MLRHYYYIRCDSCDYSEEFQHLSSLPLTEVIRSAGWSVSRDRNFHYCPKCAPKSRSVGRNGSNILSPNALKRKAIFDEPLL